MSPAADEIKTSSVCFSSPPPPVSRLLAPGGSHGALSGAWLGLDTGQGGEHKLGQGWLVGALLLLAAEAAQKVVMSVSQSVSAQMQNKAL